MESSSISLVVTRDGCRCEDEDIPRPSRLSSSCLRSLRYSLCNRSYYIQVGGMLPTTGTSRWACLFIWLLLSMTLVGVLMVVRSTEPERHLSRGDTLSSHQQDAVVDTFDEIVGPKSTICAVAEFVLWDATNNRPIGQEEPRLQLFHDAALCAGDIPRQVNVEAVVVHSALCVNATVVFNVLGTPNRHRTEFEPPYLLAGHRQSRIFGMQLPVGVYALSAVPNGNLDGRKEISFRVFDC